MPEPDGRWSEARANAWYDGRPWLVGCNFIPSTAINQLEMWQAETFDAATIERELGWAAGLGMNTVRVFLHDLLWDADPDGFARRIDAYGLQFASEPRDDLTLPEFIGNTRLRWGAPEAEAG